MKVEKELMHMDNSRAEKEKDSFVDDILNENDNGGRRKNLDRRKFAYTFHIPERRCGTDRRKGDDRRTSSRPQE